MSGTIIFFYVVEVKDCVRKQPSYMSSPSYFAAFLQTPYFYYSKVHVVGFLQHFGLEGPSNCEISRWVSRWSVFVRRCSVRRSQRSSPWNGLFVRVTTGVKFSWRHLCATLFRSAVANHSKSDFFRKMSGIQRGNFWSVLHRNSLKYSNDQRGKLDYNCLTRRYSTKLQTAKQNLTTSKNLIEFT